MAVLPDPAAQQEHVEEIRAPSRAATFEYLPMAHGVHEVAPMPDTESATLKVPARHPLQLTAPFTFGEAAP